MFLIGAVITDIREQRISNRLIAFGLVVGLILRTLGEGSIGIVHFLVNISIPVILLFLLFQLRALGAGDIKLFSLVGAFLETRKLIAVMIIAFFSGAVIGLGKILHRKIILCKPKENKTLIHFSLAIMIGYIAMVWGCAIGKNIIGCL